MASVTEIKVPVAWLPTGLISWYAQDGSPVAMVTSWVALIGGSKPRARMAWHASSDPFPLFWYGGDFVLNIPHEDRLDDIRAVMHQRQRPVNVEDCLGCATASGVIALAPRLIDFAVQVECVRGELINNEFEAELVGDVVRVHRGEIVIDPAEISDLCALQPLSP